MNDSPVPHPEPVIEKPAVKAPPRSVPASAVNKGGKIQKHLLGFHIALDRLPAVDLRAALISWSHRTPMNVSAATSLAVETCKAAGEQSLLVTLLGAPAETLRALVEHFASVAADSGMIARPRKPEQWAAEFLYLTRIETEPQAFFAKAETSAYALHSKANRLLVVTAAALAWRLRQDDPGYVVSNSPREAIAKHSAAAREAYEANTAAFYVHSYDVEKVHLSHEQLVAELKKAGQQGQAVVKKMKSSAFPPPPAHGGHESDLLAPVQASRLDRALQPV